MLARGEFAAAAAQVERSRLTHYGNKDRALYSLDLGLLEHYLGAYEKSRASLETAEQAMDDAWVKSVSRATAALILNDNALLYAGADYENVYVNIFNALNYIALDDTDGAFVEIRRIDEKLKGLEDRYWKVAQKYNEARDTDTPFVPGKNRFQNSALGRWLSLLLYRAENRWSDARVDLEKIRQAKALQPELYPFLTPDLSDALTPPKDGLVKVSFLSFTGRAPEKKAGTLWIHTQRDQVFIAASSEQRLSGPQVIYWPGIEPGLTFKFQMPYIQKNGTAVAEIRITIDGTPGPRFQQIESLENVAAETFEIQRPLIYLKAISRTVAKGLAAGQVREAAEQQWGETPALLAGLLAGAAVGVTENADLRISRFFPADAFVAETELAPGRHRIEIGYYGPGGALLYMDRPGAVEIHNDGVNLIESFYLN